MTKIEEIFQKRIDPHNQVLEHLYFKHIKGYEAIEDAMKEYAEWYANKCLTIAASESQLRCQGTTSLEEYLQSSITTTNGLEDIFVDVDIQSIINIKLPPHD